MKIRRRKDWKEDANQADINAAIARAKNKCEWCASTDRLGIDHIHPKSLGGGNVLSNFQVLCHKCGTWKGNSSPSECLERLKGLRETSAWSREVRRVAIPKMSKFICSIAGHVQGGDWGCRPNGIADVWCDRCGKMYQVAFESLPDHAQSLALDLFVPTE